MATDEGVSRSGFHTLQEDNVHCSVCCRLARDRHAAELVITFSLRRSIQGARESFRAGHKTLTEKNGLRTES